MSEKTRYRCPNCGGSLEYRIEPDEKPDGTILGYGVYVCTECDNEYEEDVELDEINLNID